ncbi:MAG: hypothetical protein AAFO79_10635, partial [Pseudomonadota bacterium]
GATALGLTALRAGDRNDCIERIMAVQRLDETAVSWATPAAGQGGAVDAASMHGVLPRAGSLCGFALTNRSPGPRELLLDPALQAHLIAGPNARMRSVTLAPGAALRFILRSVPAGKHFVVRTQADGKPSDLYILNFE